MKFLRLASVQQHRLVVLLAAVTMGGASMLLMPSSQALTATTNFVCGEFEGKPATVARTKKGDIPIVIWSSEGFSESGFTPQIRCKHVSERFQLMYRSGQLKYITAGRLNHLPVICATKQISSTCSKRNLLYTLKPDADPQQVIQRLTMVRNRSTARGVEESATISTTPANSIEVNWLEEEENN